MDSNQPTDADWLRAVAFSGLTEGDARRLHAIAERVEEHAKQREYLLKRIEDLEAENARLRTGLPMQKLTEAIAFLQAVIATAKDKQERGSLLLSVLTLLNDIERAALNPTPVGWDHV